MIPHPRRRLILLVLTIGLFTSITGCAAMPFGKPPGDNLGSCKGKMRLESGRRASFRFDLFKDGDETQLYLTIPGMYRYSLVDDMDIGDGRIEIDLVSPKRTIEGEITGDSLTFSGNFKGISGAITFDLDD